MELRTDLKISEYQKKRIDLARQQLKSGQTISNDDLQKEVYQWLILRK